MLLVPPAELVPGGNALYAACCAAAALLVLRCPEAPGRDAGAGLLRAAA